MLGKFDGSLVRWFAGSIDRWFDGSLVRWIVGSMDRWFDGSLVRWIAGSMDRWFDGSMARCFDGSLDLWIVGSMGCRQKLKIPSLNRFCFASSPGLHSWSINKYGVHRTFQLLSSVFCRFPLV